MTLKWRVLLVQIKRRLWFRAALYGVFGILTALVGAVAKPLIPPGVAAQIGASSVNNILGILAASMLTVTTFSLSIMVSAYDSAGSNASPRASVLLIEDATAQRALAGFIGVFLFSIVGLIALSTGIYGDSGRLILFGATIAVIIVIVVTLLRWIDQLSRLGRVGETIDRVEQATHDALERAARAPWRRALPYVAPGGNAVDLGCSKIGYVTHVDLDQLQALAEKDDLQVCVEATSGTFVAPGEPVARLSRKVDDALAGKLADAFVVNDLRSFDDDPHFGLVVLTEIALRALSPAVNDPGTAIDVLGTITRLLCQWVASRREAETEPVRYNRVYIRAVDEAAFFEQVFAPLARESAGILEVAERLQRSLATLGQLGYPPFAVAAAVQAARALELSQGALHFAADRARLEAGASWSRPAT